MKRINVFVGNYGSGKTELSINMAKKLKKESKEVLLVDMDIVNPYFRSSKHSKMLKEEDIELVCPTFANTAVDLPTLPPDVYKVFSTDKHVIIDCGGDPAGATAMGFLASRFSEIEEELEVFFVINTARPLQSDFNTALEMIRSIEHASKLKITKLILNSNVARDTTYHYLEQGLDVAEKISKHKKLDIAFISGTKDVLNEFKKHHPDLPYDLYYIDIFMRPEWLDM